MVEGRWVRPYFLDCCPVILYYVKKVLLLQKSQKKLSWKGGSSSPTPALAQDHPQESHRCTWERIAQTTPPLSSPPSLPSGHGGGRHGSLALLLLLFLLLLMQMKSDAVPVLQPPLDTCRQSSGVELAERAVLGAGAEPRVGAGTLTPTSPCAGGT